MYLFVGKVPWVPVSSKAQELELQFKLPNVDGGMQTQVLSKSNKHS